MKYSYKALDETQLTVNAGDILTLISDDNPDWLHVRTSSNDGYIPRSYVELLPKCLVLYDFLGKTDTELSISKNSIVYLLSNNGEWSEGESNGLIGYFPSSYIQKIQGIVIFDFKSRDFNLKTGDIIDILKKDGEWIYGSLHGTFGYVPQSYIGDVPKVAHIKNL